MKKMVVLFFLFGCARVIDYYDPDLPAKWDANYLRSIGGITVSISHDFGELDGLQYNEDGLHMFESMAKRWDDAVPWIDFFSFPFDMVNNLDYSSEKAYKDNQMGIYNSTSWKISDDPTILAATSYYGKTRNGYKVLTHVDIIVNDKYHNFTFDPNEWGKFYLPCIILHELGHMVGLPHSNEEGSVMVEATHHGNNKCDLSLMDIQNIRDKYSDSNNSRSPASSYTEDYQENERHGEVYFGTHKLRVNGSCIHERI
ncbi:MAG: matrixin family metalloprotease [Halobacteriovoraceae bacterium]|nr:matrixin family metalloprotease [Halobacteriovoraceae bacterium]